MELIILLIVVVGIIGWWIWKEGKSEQAGNHPLESITKKLDVNHDGRVDAKDAVAVVAEAKETVSAAADVNKDGQVNIEDAKVVVEKTKKAGRKAKAKVEETVEKVKKTRKPKAK